MDKKLLIELIGYLGVILNTSSSFLQVYKTYTSKTVEGLSLPFLLCWALGYCFLLLYIILTTWYLPTFLNYLFNILMPATLICFYINYSKTKKN